MSLGIQLKMRLCFYLSRIFSLTSISLNIGMCPSVTREVEALEILKTVVLTDSIICRNDCVYKSLIAPYIVSQLKREYSGLTTFAKK